MKLGMLTLAICALVRAIFYKNIYLKKGVNLKEDFLYNNT